MRGVVVGRVESHRLVEVTHRAVDVVLDEHVPAEDVADAVLRLDREQLVCVLLGALLVARQVRDLRSGAQDVRRSRVEPDGAVDEPTAFVDCPPRAQASA